jgi:hypothetical protein
MQECFVSGKALLLGMLCLWEHFHVGTLCPREHLGMLCLWEQFVSRNDWSVGTLCY